MESSNPSVQMEWDEYLDTRSSTDLSTFLPIVYSKNYGVKFCGLQKLHPFDAAKGEHVLKFLIDGHLITDDNYMQPLEVKKIDLKKIHTKKYLRSLKVRKRINKNFITLFLSVEYNCSENFRDSFSCICAKCYRTTMLS